ncbi:hypothetical protein Pmani_003684 [Petrolisthes manimaculis]|uniref:Uncharacterized protein n=1 Tax=Petrolisthes manimaculis TaxID=1843537 RepID=A0AAE1QFH6_9EUCA|nr:hypothetical protein Pmani_003684 [Petrolisthes manimaculis]
MVIFSATDDLRFLAQSRHWFGDGTFKVTPEIAELRPTLSIGVFQLDDFGQDANMTQTKLSKLVAHARQLREAARCVMVVVMSDDLNFLTIFAESALKGRLLVWSTRLLVFSRLLRENLMELFSSHWAFSMTNSMLINADLFVNNLR